MKRLLFVMIILSGTICHAQLPAPCQIDTLIITCIRYNYDEIDRVNWPFSVIYKSTTFFKFAETKFVIQDITKLGDEIYFTVVNSLENTYGQEEYSLVYKEIEGKIVIEFSGYEFICHKYDQSMSHAESSTLEECGALRKMHLEIMTAKKQEL